MMVRRFVLLGACVWLSCMAAPVLFTVALLYTLNREDIHASSRTAD